jgi:hypothetical protein
MSASALTAMTDGDVSQLEHVLAEHLFREGVGVPGIGERRSWRHSLPVLARELDEAGLGKVEVILEHRLPLSSRRADVVLAGVHPETRARSYVVVELKQWGRAARWEGSDTLVEVEGAPYRPSLHPSLQVAAYVDYMRDFTATLSEEDVTLSGVAYLPNATDFGVDDLRSMPAAQSAALVTGQRRGELREVLRGLLAPDPGADAADALLDSPVHPSRQLLSVAAAEVREREQFVLLDEQRVAYEMVLSAVVEARASQTKTVLVVSGGPGSGKSVIALSLLGELAREGRTVLHATGSRSFTQTLRQVAGKGSSRVKNLFVYFNSFMTAEEDGLDVLILDEAHRVRETSVNRYTPRALRDRARPQVDELLDAARVPVFLLDQHQVVRPGEMGSIADIERAARARGLQVRHVDLHAQFRAGGSARYVDWVERLLGLRDGGPVVWEDEPGFTVDVVDSPHELETRLQSLSDAGHKARMTAGYCWRWSDPRPDGTLVPDVQIGSWSRPWNLKGDRATGGAPPSPLWATDPAGFGQVGCVYTAQGFEYDWNGVILGPDLVWRDGTFVSHREQNRDPEFRSRTDVDDRSFDRLVRQVYKVLLTRGMVGTLLYSPDEETRSILRGLVAGRH